MLMNLPCLHTQPSSPEGVVPTFNIAHDLIQLPARPLGTTATLVAALQVRQLWKQPTGVVLRLTGTSSGCSTSGAGLYQMVALYDFRHRYCSSPATSYLKTAQMLMLSPPDSQAGRQSYTHVSHTYIHSQTGRQCHKDTTYSQSKLPAILQC